jgi:Fungal N-terminal domain of STAND proteins
MGGQNYTALRPRSVQSYYRFITVLYSKCSCSSFQYLIFTRSLAPPLLQSDVKHKILVRQRSATTLRLSFRSTVLRIHIMADPLSVSASAAGLISLAAAVTQSCYGMYREIKNAPRMLKDVIDELSLLHQVLSDLKDICEQMPEPLAPLDNVLKDIQNCRIRLEEFESRLGLNFRNPRNFFSRIRWSFGGSEIKAFVNQLQNYRSLFESAKTNGTLMLAISIRSNVESESLLQDLARKGITSFSPLILFNNPTNRSY